MINIGPYFLKISSSGRLAKLVRCERRMISMRLLLCVWLIHPLCQKVSVMHQKAVTSHQIKTTEEEEVSTCLGIFHCVTDYMCFSVYYGWYHHHCNNNIRIYFLPVYKSINFVRFLFSRCWQEAVMARLQLKLWRPNLSTTPRITTSSTWIKTLTGTVAWKARGSPVQSGSRPSEGRDSPKKRKNGKHAMLEWF